MKHVIASRLLRGLAIVLATFPLLAQHDFRGHGVRIGDYGRATAQLKLLSSPPKWWSIKLNESGESLDEGTKVEVLEIRALSTLFGRDTWIQVQTVPDESESEGQESQRQRSGWIYGGTSGETLVPTDPPTASSSGDDGNGGRRGSDD